MSSKKALWLFAVLIVLIVLVSACVPVLGLESSAGKSAMIRIFDMTIETVRTAWLWPVWIFGLGMTVAAGIFFAKILTLPKGILAAVLRKETEPSAFTMAGGL